MYGIIADAGVLLALLATVAFVCIALGVHMENMHAKKSRAITIYIALAFVTFAIFCHLAFIRTSEESWEDAIRVSLMLFAACICWVVIRTFFRRRMS